MDNYSVFIFSDISWLTHLPILDNAFVEVVCISSGSFMSLVSLTSTHQSLTNVFCGFWK